MGINAQVCHSSSMFPHTNPPTSHKGQIGVTNQSFHSRLVNVTQTRRPCTLDNLGVPHILTTTAAFLLAELLRTSMMPSNTRDASSEEPAARTVQEDATQYSLASPSTLRAETATDAKYFTGEEPIVETFDIELRKLGGESDFPTQLHIGLSVGFKAKANSISPTAIVSSWYCPVCNQISLHTVVLSKESELESCALPAFAKTTAEILNTEIKDQFDTLAQASITSRAHLKLMSKYIMADLQLRMTRALTTGVENSSGFVYRPIQLERYHNHTYTFKEDEPFSPETWTFLLRREWIDPTGPDDKGRWHYGCSTAMGRKWVETRDWVDGSIPGGRIKMICSEEGA